MEPVELYWKRCQAFRELCEAGRATKTMHGELLDKAKMQELAAALIREGIAFASPVTPKPNK